MFGILIQQNQNQS